MKIVNQIMKSIYDFDFYEKMEIYLKYKNLYFIKNYLLFSKFSHIDYIYTFPSFFLLSRLVKLVL